MENSISSIQSVEELQRSEQLRINALAADRAVLEAKHGRVWTLEELKLEFRILQFAAPLLIVERITDRQLGTVYFQHMPRFYFSFEVDKK